MVLLEKNELLRRVPDRMFSKDELEFIIEGMPSYSTMKRSIFMTKKKLEKLLDLEHLNNDRLVYKLCALENEVCELQNKINELELKNECEGEYVKRWR